MDDSARLAAMARRYITAAGPAKKQLLSDILAVPGAEQILFSRIFSTDMRACLRVLADAARRKKSREVLHPLVIAHAGEMLAIPDAKARKTASVLIGLAAPNECAPLLSGALAAEQTRFVRPSIILALGHTDDPASYLSDYVIEPGDEKHVREEAEALKKALASALPHQTAAGFSLPGIATVTSVHTKALLAEFADTGVAYVPNRVIDDTFDVASSALGSLRCFGDALYYIGTLHDFAAAAAQLDAFGCSGLACRIEAGPLPTGERRKIVRAVSSGLFKHGYTDNPGAYAFEIRVVKNALFFNPLSDARFSYRVQSLPASISPAVAACMMRLCRPYMHPDAAVLDPFCGSGVMLIERAQLMPAASLTGVDIAADAIKAASANRKASSLPIALIRSDIRRFGAAQYDEVVSNMPFGIRVSDHQSNVALYSDFFEKLRSLLRPGGAAFLFTQEKKLLRSLVEKNPQLSIAAVHRFETGGLNPNLYILIKEH